MTETIPAQHGGRAADLVAATLLALTALLSLILIMHHPVLHQRMDVAHASAAILAQAGMDRFVHGGLMVMIFLQAIGFCVFSNRLGLGRPAVAGGLIAFLAGAFFTCIPATLDGFVTPDLAKACPAQTGGCGVADAVTLRLVAILIQDFTKLGLVAMAVAALLWSLALLAGGRSVLRWSAAAVGLACAGGSLWVLLFNDVYLQPGNLMAITGSEVAWALVAAGLLASGALRPRM